MSDNRSTDEVFEYMGNNQRAQYDVVSVRLHPSVEEICPYVFYRCNSLKMVVLKATNTLTSLGGCGEIVSPTAAPVPV